MYRKHWKHLSHFKATIPWQGEGEREWMQPGEWNGQQTPAWTLFHWLVDIGRGEPEDDGKDEGGASECKLIV